MNVICKHCGQIIIKKDSSYYHISGFKKCRGGKTIAEPTIPDEK